MNFSDLLSVGTNFDDFLGLEDTVSSEVLHFFSDDVSVVLVVVFSADADVVGNHVLGENGPDAGADKETRS